MLGKIKKVLGIEGVKVELIVNTPIDKKNQKISGELKFTTKTTGKVQKIYVKLIEKYSRGRGKSKLIDEYTVAILEMNDSFEIKPEEIIEIPFSLNYEIALSEMDKMQKEGLFSKPIISLAKFIKQVKSEFTLVVEADVQGTTLNPFDKAIVKL
ncbi:MAG: sporulation protein [Saprospiraceae bacterium]|nr:sporulation protein [Saprospiraceae bacterium]